MTRALLFLRLTIVLSLPWWWMVREHSSAAFVTFLMWSPALAAVITLKTTGGDLGDLGWRGAEWKWTFEAWVTTFLAACIVHAIVFSARLVDVHESAPVTLMNLSIAATAGMIRLAGPALGEELGWRGFLVPALCRRFGFTAGSLLTGAIWALWHFPLMIGRVPVLGLVNFAAMILGMSLAFAWFRLRSQSVWPSTVMHALHNALVPTFVKMSASGATADRWLDETGIALVRWVCSWRWCF
ncbi:MAG: CPBP family intramembrane glutamic endopeptidase [Thermoanaerobaculia bacterium]